MAAIDRQAVRRIRELGGCLATSPKAPEKGDPSESNDKRMPWSHPFPSDRVSDHPDLSDLRVPDEQHAKGWPEKGEASRTCSTVSYSQKKKSILL